MLVDATMQVYDTAEWFTGRLYSILMIMMRMYAINCITVQSCTIMDLNSMSVDLRGEDEDFSII
jgi:hypothetical protein